MQTIDHETEAVAAARRCAESKGIRTHEVVAVKRLSGELRAQYLPNATSDFWIVTLKRSTDIIPDMTGMSSEDIDVMNIIAEQLDEVAVAVELNGECKVV